MLLHIGNSEKLVTGSELESDPDNPYFKVLWSGLIDVYDVWSEIVNYDPNSFMPEDVQLALEQQWSKVTNKSPNDSLATRYGYRGHIVDESRLTLWLTPQISYKYNFITRQPGFIKEHNYYPISGLGVTTILLTTEEEGYQMVLTHRNNQHDYKPGGIHFIGGYATHRPDDSHPVLDLSRPSPEIIEEVGLGEHEIAQLYAVGILRTNDQDVTELVFLAITPLSAQEVLNRKGDDENTVFCMPLNEPNINKLIHDYAEIWVAGGLGAMLVLGQEFLGMEWYQQKMLSLGELKQDCEKPMTLDQKRNELATLVNELLS